MMRRRNTPSQEEDRISGGHHECDDDISEMNDELQNFISNNENEVRNFVTTRRDYIVLLVGFLLALGSVRLYGLTNTNKNLSSVISDTATSTYTKSIISDTNTAAEDRKGETFNMIQFNSRGDGDLFDKVININKTGVGNGNAKLHAVVHMGVAKTGSTTIQTQSISLKESLKLDSFEMPWAAVKRQKSGEGPMQQMQSFADCFIPFGSGFKCNPDLLQYGSDIATRNRSVFITSETFAHIDETGIDKLIEYLSQWPKHTIVIFYRRFHDWTASFYKQNTRSRGFSDTSKWERSVLDFATNYIRQVPRHYITELEKRLMEKFDDENIIVMNFHDTSKGGPHATLYCDPTLNMPHTCEAIQNEEEVPHENNKGEINLDYSDLAYGAMKASLVRINSNERMNQVATAVRDYHKSVLNGTAFKRVCLPQADLDKLLNMSLTYEMKYFPEQVDSLKSDFEKLANTTLCKIDADHTLKDTQWRDFFSALSNEGNEDKLGTNKKFKSLVVDEVLPAFEANIVDAYSEDDGAVPMLWHIPKAGGTTAKGILGGCLGLVIASRYGAVAEQKEIESSGLVYSGPDSIRIMGQKGGRRYINVDVTTPDGINKAKKLDPIGSGLVDVIVTPIIRPVIEGLLSPRRVVKARLFGIFRHPVERAASLFYYLQSAHWERTYKPEFANMTLLEWTKSSKVETNWMMRNLVGVSSRDLNEEHLELAKNTLRRKFVVGLTTEMKLSWDNFQQQFGWQNSTSKRLKCMSRMVEVKANANQHEKIQKGSNEWEALAAVNKWDVALYEYIVTLFWESQGSGHNLEASKLETVSNNKNTTSDIHEGALTDAIDSDLQFQEDEASSDQSFPQQYTFSDTLYESSLWKLTFCILVYDPPTNKFIALYNKDHMWRSGNRKLWKALQHFTYMLRQIFPQRFQGESSDELVIPVGGGDYPHVNPSNLPHSGVAPVLMFGSAFRDPQMYSNMVAMPVPVGHHLGCFVEWVETNMTKVCDLLQSGKLVFGKDVDEGLEYDSLIPQLIWRGTDFLYLPTLKQGPSLVKPNASSYVDPLKDENSRRRDAIQALNEQIDTLIPRWKGVALTASAELKVQDTDDMPWANIKFSTYPEAGKSPTIGSDEYALWESVGIATGESMNLTELAHFKYHIDLGGGGGTTWSGTIQKLAMPGLLFHHITPTKDYFHDNLTPWKHYIPVSASLQDLKQQFDWAEKNPNDAKRIANAGTDFVKEFGTLKGFEKIFKQHFVVPVRKVIETYKPVADGLTWRDVLVSMGDDNRVLEVMQCTGSSPNQDSCEMMGGDEVEEFQTNGYYSNDPRPTGTNIEGDAQENKHKAAGIANSQWCRAPEEDQPPALPIDYNKCENTSQLIHVDINGGMTSQLNKILKVAIWAAHDKSCFYINEEKVGYHFSHSKLGYRVDENDNDYYMTNFFDRYFEHMGLFKSRWERMIDPKKGKQFNITTPSPGDIQEKDVGGGRSSITTDDPKKRFRLRSIPSLGYIDVDNISLKKRFLRRMFRIKPTTRDRACQRVASHGLNEEYMALSIRRGDKVTETPVLETVDPYIKEAEKAIASHFGGTAPTFFVATDDCAVMQQFREQRPHWTFFSECDNTTDENGFVLKEMKHWTEEETDKHFNKFIAELIAMASAKFWIGVPTTNVSYWVYFMRPLEARDDTYVFVEKPRVPGLPW